MENKILKILTLSLELFGDEKGAKCFLQEPRECWAGLTAQHLMAIGKEEAVLKFLERLDDGDPIS